MPPLETVWVSLVPATARTHVEAVICAEADCWGQESFFGSGTDDPRLRIENERQ